MKGSHRARDLSQLPEIRVEIRNASIEDCHRSRSTPPIDAIAGGIYTGVAPSGAVASLDQSLSAALHIEEPGRLLTDLIQRGTIRGDLGTPFLIPDPRDPQPRSARRLIALAGLGTPGRCGLPELTMAFRELFWLLNALDHKHVATLLIGSGEGNLSIPDAVESLLTGLARALNSAHAINRQHTLETVTIVERNPGRINEIADAIDQQKDKLRSDNRFLVHFHLPDAAKRKYDKSALQEELAKIKTRRTELTTQFKKNKSTGSKGKTLIATSHTDGRTPATRITFSMDRNVYSFGAVSDSASIPERTVEVNSLLVDQANDQLVSADQPDIQQQYGQLLGHILIPKDLECLFHSQEPLVIEVDSRSARIHWEMVAVGEPNPLPDQQITSQHLGLTHGFTRQLRTGFAPPPEPPPPLRRNWRILIIADPAREASLPGARREAEEIAALFEEFQQVYQNGVTTEVISLIGPENAQAITVLKHLTLQHFDVLHFAGHCRFDVDHPSSSGWLFDTNPEIVMSARELRRIDHMPRFVFSNACESGVTPEHPELRNSKLVPSFAEAFFECGITNLVCTAWPVDDNAARLFARNLYAGLLGLKVADTDTLMVSGSADPLSMHDAMRNARKKARLCPTGARTWGAYQHYGNPYYQFFAQGISAFLNPHYTPRTPPIRDSRNSTEPYVESTAPTDPSTQHLAGLPPPTDFAAVFAALEKYRGKLAKVKNVVAVRAGYRFRDGWITDEPVISVRVVRKKPLDQLSSEERLPATVTVKVNGRSVLVGIDVSPATPIEQALHLAQNESERQQVWDWLDAHRVSLDEPVEPGQELSRTPANLTVRKATEAYTPPSTKLEVVDEPMAVTCHNSPSDSWSVLKRFLEATRRQLTVAMYDFTATHIRDTLIGTMKQAGRKLSLVLDPGQPRGGTGIEGEFRDTLSKALANRFSFAWASVLKSGFTSGGLFNNAYHIKVAVRDSEAIWLSSGNWQPQNQPSPDIPPQPTMTQLRSCNREWHIVIENKALAETFEAYIKHDLSKAQKFQPKSQARGFDEFPFDLLMPEMEEVSRGLPKVFPSLNITGRRIRVQPVLTPDNYAEEIVPLILSARKTLYFQNQYITIKADDSMSPDFTRLCKALRHVIAGGQVDVRIILRGEGDVARMLTALQRFGIPPRIIRLQNRCHNKGIVVDSSHVALGSHNWSVDGTTRNRDATLIVHDSDVAKYYEKIFLYDWENLARQTVPGEKAMPIVVRKGTSSRGLPKLPDGSKAWRKSDWGDYYP